jgi:hypothetical protein
MKHLNEEELLDHHYGESESPAGVSEHLRDCRDCARHYATLERDLAEIKPLPVPARDAAYGEQVWQSIRGSLPVYQAPKRSRWGWLALSPWGFAAAATACLLVAAAFFAGRQWEHRNTPIATTPGSSSEQGRQRVVLVVLGDHLDRSERLLVELKHSDPSTEAPLQAEARDLLSVNRLYRESVKSSQDPVMANALDHLGRVLTEVANEPKGLSRARLDQLQKEMNTDGLLFEVRVLRSRVQEDVDESSGASPATKGVSI